MRQSTRVCLWVGISLGLAAPAGAQPVPVYRQVAGEIRRVAVEPGDSLLRLAAQNGVSWRTLAADNGIVNPDRIRPGRVLRVDTRRIVPALLDDGVVINVPEATLYVFEGGSLTARYPVGLGRPSRPTPTGSFTVLFREMHPEWSDPDSLEQELEREDRVVARKAVPDPAQALGEYWIQLSRWGYGMHGTRFLSTVGQFLGEGCVRVRQADMPDLYRRLREGTRVEIVDEPVKLAVTPSGELWVEAHPDVYGDHPTDADAVLAALDGQSPGAAVDRQALEKALADRLGLAQQIGTAAAPAPGGSRTDADAFRAALWRCLDCPPGANRRVTFQIEARAPLDLPNPFPIEIRDDAGRVVFRPQMVAQTLVHLEPGESRNFVWEVRDTEGQPLPPGSYVAVIRFFRPGPGSPVLQTLSLPMWVGN